MPKSTSVSLSQKFIRGPRQVAQFFLLFLANVDSHDALQIFVAMEKLSSDPVTMDLRIAYTLFYQV